MAPEQRKAKTRQLLLEYAKSHSTATRDQLVELNADLVHFIAQRFANRGEPLEDIEQVGFVGLIHAIDRFDPTLDNEFSTFATPTVMGEIRRYFRDKSWALRVPRRLQENYGRAMRAREELRLGLGREPTIAEIGEAIGLQPSDVLAALEVSPAQRTLSFSMAIGDADGDDSRSLGSTLGAPDDNLERVEISSVLERVMEHLTPRERQVMALRFVDQLPQTEVAKRMGISQMHVSRLQRAAIERVRGEFTNSGVEEEDLVT